jgi:hypothetical protein
MHTDLLLITSKTGLILATVEASVRSDDDASLMTHLGGTIRLVGLLEDFVTFSANPRVIDAAVQCMISIAFLNVSLVCSFG